MTVNDKPKLSEYRDARNRGDMDAAEELIRRIHAWHAANPKPPPPPPRADVTRDLRHARYRNDLKEARAVLVDAHKQKQAHLLDAEDLVWFVEERRLQVELECGLSDRRLALPPWAGPPRAGSDRRGDRQLRRLATARRRPPLDRAAPDRWLQCAFWRAGLTHMDLCSELKTEACARPVSWDTPELRHRYKQCAVEWYADRARRVIDERGDAARRSLRVAPAVAAPGHNVRLVLEAWAEALT